MQNRSVIVIACGYNNPKDPDFSQYRVDVAEFTANQNAAVIICCGAATRKDLLQTEANLIVNTIKNWYQINDLPLPEIIEEDKSFCSDDNIKFAKKIILRRGYNPEKTLVSICCKVEKAVWIRFLADKYFEPVWSPRVYAFDNSKPGEAEREIQRIISKYLASKLTFLKKIQIFLKKRELI